MGTFKVIQSDDVVTAVLAVVHLAFNANESQLFCRSISVVEKELFARLYGPFGEDPDSVIAVDHHHFGVTVRVNRVIGESDFVALSSGVHHIVCNQSISQLVNVQQME